MSFIRITPSLSGNGDKKSFKPSSKSCNPYRSILNKRSPFDVTLWPIIWRQILQPGSCHFPTLLKQICKIISHKLGKRCPIQVLVLVGQNDPLIVWDRYEELGLSAYRATNYCGISTGSKIIYPIISNCCKRTIRWCVLQGFVKWIIHIFLRQGRNPVIFSLLKIIIITFYP